MYNFNVVIILIWTCIPVSEVSNHSGNTIRMLVRRNDIHSIFGKSWVNKLQQSCRKKMASFKIILKRLKFPIAKYLAANVIKRVFYLDNAAAFCCFILLRALPAWNHLICASFIEWLRDISSVLPLLCFRIHLTGYNRNKHGSLHVRSNIYVYTFSDCGKRSYILSYML